MNFREYKNEIENFSQNSTKISENLTKTKHKMFMKGKNLKRQFKDCYDILLEESIPLEKTELIDFWKIENGWTNKKR